MLIKKLKPFYPIIFFMSGFLFDVITTDRIDDYFSTVTFLIYIIISYFCFHLETLEQREGVKKLKIFTTFKKYSNEIFHYCQGSLLSVFTLIFFKSSSLSSSFLFMSFLVLLLFCNELPFLQTSKKDIKSIFFHITLMSFLLIYTPIAFGFINIFITLVSLIIYLALCYLITKHFKEKTFFRQASVITLIFIILRFFNMTPPVPLSLQSAGIYHNVEKNYPEYLLSHEKPWWRIWHNSDQEFNARDGDQIFFFTRVFAPRGFKDKIYVRWEFKINGSWQTSDRIELPITGGRRHGFRGFTYKKNYPEGQGRIFVETSSGQEIGRMSFNITKTNERPATEMTVVTDP